jgi:hypothetical protein
MQGLGCNDKLFGFPRVLQVEIQKMCTLGMFFNSRRLPLPAVSIPLLPLLLLLTFAASLALPFLASSVGALSILRSCTRKALLYRTITSLYIELVWSSLVSILRPTKQKKREQ